MSKVDTSLSLAHPQAHRLPILDKIGLTIGSLGLLLLFVVSFGISLPNQGLFLALSLGAITLGTILFAHGKYSHLPAGIKNNGVWFKSMTSRGAIGWVTGIVLTGFYVLLYWFPAYLGLGQNAAANTGMVAFFDPLSYALKGQPASQWFVYGTLYTVAILALGYKFILKYRHNRYQIFRTISVMFFQLGFAFLLPELLARLSMTNAELSNLPYNDFKNMWPLNYYFFDGWNIKAMLSSGNLGLFMLLWGIAMIFIVSPFLTYFYGKRWYCSWVCGCGGLAETAGDPYRHLSDKSLNAWKLERWLIHSVLVFAVVMTVAVLYSFLHNEGGLVMLSKQFFVFGVIGLLVALAVIAAINYKRWFSDKNRIALFLGIGVVVLIAGLLGFAWGTGSGNVFFVDSYPLRKWYGFVIGAAFSGVIGVGFYPLLGSRVWCRFGCPMAAILGIQQRFFSRFRITTNGSQCISCGNCSAYCEMGIDVRSYAQRGQNVVRASCVGCGICAAVCPRGVLRLEGGPEIGNRTEELRTIHISADEVKLMM